MCKEFIYLSSFLLVLSLGFPDAIADPVPAPWGSQTIGDDAPIGSADHDPGAQTFTVIGDGHDIWDAADDFRQASRGQAALRRDRAPRGRDDALAAAPGAVRRAQGR